MIFSLRVRWGEVRRERAVWRAVMPPPRMRMYLVSDIAVGFGGCKVR